MLWAPHASVPAPPPPFPVLQANGFDISFLGGLGGMLNANGINEHPSSFLKALKNSNSSPHFLL